MLDKTIYPYAPLFLAPAITTLYLGLEGRDGNSSFTMRLSLLPSLAVACPALTHVQLVGVVDDTGPLASWHGIHTNEVLAVPSAICQWTNLRNLSLENIFGRTVFCTSNLPALRELKLSFIDSPGVDVVHVSKGFPVLERLEVYCGGIDFCTKLIDLMLETPLRFLNLFLSGTSSASELQALFKTMHDCLVHQSLEHFSCLTSFLATGDAELVTLSVMRLRPLRSRYIQNQFKMDWPPGAASLPLPSIAQYLSLAVDTTEVNEYDERPGKGVSNETLTVYGSPIAEPTLVASFLSDIFPRLETIFFDSFIWEENQASFEVYEEWKSKWAITEKLVRAFAAIRRQERVYCAGNTHRCPDK
ncbi:hypothetical protein AX17_004984 [Amanita inopinata Kibby_2008]|nr:hypothetical protein AX17_004984 [Amanita inopinata Kibby_2008]